MRQFIAFSGGVESTTMCLLYGKTANALFADTGFEHRKLYERLDLIEDNLKVLHGDQFNIIRVKNKRYDSLPAYIRETKFYPSFTARYCTRKFKIEPIDDYLEQFQEEGVELMIGLNADEIDKRTGNHGNLPFVKYSYPLAENDLGRKDCEELLKKANLYPNFPAYMKRGGCVGCFYKSKKEYEAMLHLAPEEFEGVNRLEKEIQDQRKDFYCIKKEMGSMESFKLKILSQPEMFRLEEVYNTEQEETKCGVFCNR